MAMYRVYQIFMALVICVCLNCVHCVVRPVWNMGHMVNAIAQVDEFLDLGANALEADITFSKNGQAEYTYHGWPCDCFRNCRRWEYIDTYLDYISQVTSPGNKRFKQQLILFSLDIKTGSLYENQKAGAMKDLAERLVRSLWKNGRSNSRIKVLVHLQKTNEMQYVRNFLRVFDALGVPHLKGRVGFELSSGDSLNSINNGWRSLGISNVWQGDGITNCLPRSTSRLREIVANRNLGNTVIKKTYWWTVDKWGTIQDLLRIGVDGIMTNHPDRVKGVLQENEFRGRFRMATFNDDPFQKVTPGYYEAGFMYQGPDVVQNVDPAEEDIFSYH